MIKREPLSLPDLGIVLPQWARVAAVMVLGASAMLFGSLLLPPGLPRLGSVTAGITLACVAAAIAIRIQVTGRAQIMAVDLLNRFIERDATPSFVTDDDGRVHARNRAACVRFTDSEGETLAAILRMILANPSAVLYRLQCRARIDGNAREDVVTRRGHVRLAVHLMGEQGFLWRVEDFAERPQAGRGADTLPIPMITVGRTGAVLFMNEAARTLVGQRAKSLDRLFVSLPPVPGQINMLTTAEGPVPTLVAERQGPAGRTEIYFLPTSEGCPVHNASDFDLLPVAMLKVAASGEVLKTNRLAAELLGREVIEPTQLGQLMQGLGRPIADWLGDTFENRQSPKSEFLKLSREDREVFVQVTLSRVIEDGTPIVVAVLSDATELKTLEAQFVQSQKMQAIGQLAGGVAHDFNNLLTAISGHCDLLLLRHDQGDQDYGDLVQINQNANRAAALVSQLLAFSRKQTLRPEPIDLRDTLSDLTHLLNRLVGEKVTLTLSHDPVLKPIRADKRQLEQVLMNLVVNARDAMPQGGEIRIETEVETLEGPQNRDRATIPAGQYVTVRVCDEGVGIPSDKLQKVFEPFFTTKRTGEGTGLGLSTAYGIIKQTGGFIFVDSVPNRGTTFTLFFPAHDEIATERPAAEPKPAQTVAVHGEGVVLLVEDEAPVRAFASRALRLRGYTVLEAASAEEALQTLEDPELLVDVFVTDVVMPGMDGPSWVREALKKRPQVRVVFVSGYAEGAFEDTKPAVPNSVFLPKPFSLRQLTDTVHRQLH
ncbi:ATP-binding protein [Primorskyibacter sp. S87]|uniref:hybrid sensor histidine kinase/response regulator n=1 Tax=Primorskyibacter sp. S87 TaxID=3415126 RepID=UPI003C7C7628